jgi:hypothetical protein
MIETIENLTFKLANAKDARDLVDSMVNTGVELIEISGRAIDMLSESWDFKGLNGRWKDKDADFAAYAITVFRNECRCTLDDLDWLVSSCNCMKEEDWLGVFCSAATDLSCQSWMAEVSLDSVGGDAGRVAIGQMRDLHGKIACLERMAYRWLGRKGQPRQGQSRTGYEISVCMNFGPLRPAPSGAGKVSFERIRERGMRLMWRANTDRTLSCTRRGR